MSNDLYLNVATCSIASASCVFDLSSWSFKFLSISSFAFKSPWSAVILKIHKPICKKYYITSQQTTTHHFTCSVSEFMSSTSSIQVNSPDSVNKFGVSTRVNREITSFSGDDTYQWNHTSSDPVRLMSNSFKTRDTRQNTCIHVNTHENTYWWSGTNYEPVWHVSFGSEMVPCLLG